MAKAQIILGELGSGGGATKLFVDTVVGNSSTIAVDCGFIPKYILITRTNAPDNSPMVMSYDATIKTTKYLRLGVWQDFGTGSIYNLVSVGTNGFTGFVFTGSTNAFEWHIVAATDE